MTAEAWAALTVIVPSFFSLVAVGIGVWNNRNINKSNKKVDINNEKVEVLHKLINSGLTVRLDEAKKSGILTGKLEEKENQEKKEEEKTK